ncbi:MAG: hypothetical protein AAF368_04505 [Planctomycetota bacterium]
MRRRQLITIISGLLLALGALAHSSPAAPSAAQNAEATTQIYDVRPLLELLQQRQAAYRGYSPLAYLDLHPDLESNAPFGFEVDPENSKRAFGLPRETHPRILDWLSIFDRALVDGEALLEVTDLGGFLRVDTEAWAHPVLIEFLSAAERSLRSRLKLEAWVLSASGDNRSLHGVVSKQEVEEVLRGSHGRIVLGPFQSTGGLNRLFAVGSWSKRDLVWDMDGETAGDRTVPYPNVGPLETGLRLHVDARRGAHGGYVVRVRGQHSGDIKLKRATTMCTGGLSLEIDLPSIRLQQIGATATIEDGGGLLLGLTGEIAGEPGELWLLRLSSSEEGSVGANQPLLPDPFLPTGEWTAPGNDFSPSRHIVLFRSSAPCRMSKATGVTSAKEQEADDNADKPISSTYL